MKPFAPIVLLLLSFCLIPLCQSPTRAQSSSASTTNASNSPTCEGLARACAAAADEIEAARKLIAGYERERAAADARLAEAGKQLELQAKLAELYKERADALAAQVAAEKGARVAVEGLIAERDKKIASIEAKLKRSRRLGVLAAVAAFILGVTR